VFAEYKDKLVVIDGGDKKRAIHIKFQSQKEIFTAIMRFVLIFQKLYER